MLETVGSGDGGNRAWTECRSDRVWSRVSCVFVSGRSDVVVVAAAGALSDVDG
jgi:hypothetical protein